MEIPVGNSPVRSLLSQMRKLTAGEEVQEPTAQEAAEPAKPKLLGTKGGTLDVRG
jgi:hypothetical protein